MSFKLIVLTALVAAAQAGNLIGAPVATTYTAGIAPLPAFGAALAPAPVLRTASFGVAHPAPLLRSASIGLAPAPVLRTAAIGFGAPVAKVAVAAPVAKTVIAEEYDPNPQYSYGYEVQDGLTGDNKNQVESRNGDVVQGSYSLNEPDGTRRIVDYTADPVNGFNAVVRKEPLVAKAVVAAPAIAKVASPVAGFAAAPLTYSAPLATRIASPVAVSAPIAKFGSPLAYSTSVLH